MITTIKQHRPEISPRNIQGSAQTILWEHINMKVSSLSAASMMQTADSHSASEPVFIQLRKAANALIGKLDQMGTAIALGESGDLDAAHALREKYSIRKRRS
jgi:hypothetical protein